MLSIRIHGRAGQGVLTAGKLLSQAFFYEGKYVQSFSIFGPEKRGSHVVSSIRVNKKPILERGPVLDPDVVILFDKSLLQNFKNEIFQGIKAQGILIINSKEKFLGPVHKTIEVDACSIAQEIFGKQIYSIILLAPLIKLNIVSQENLEKAVAKVLGEDFIPQNIKALRKSIESVKL
ncbi:MAG: 2-oxoacid:acceptor oxidoreductase family protein [archaeon]